MQWLTVPFSLPIFSSLGVCLFPSALNMAKGSQPMWRLGKQMKQMNLTGLLFIHKICIVDSFIPLTIFGSSEPSTSTNPPPTLGKLSWNQTLGGVT